ncbi:MAG: TonB-dependent receptor plug domain-containing protein [Treponema sp.]|jgi:hypothetical protein|nr:TonB-dependent receptor plug domain-containing protein [Treponema sp.]
MKYKYILLILLISPLTLLYGRDVEITVEDADLSIPLEGAAIRSWDGTVSYCDEDGKITLSVPDDRQVTIQASYPGYENGFLNIPVNGARFTLGLYLSGVLVGNELLIEAQRPGVSETRSGRSVAISGEALERSSQIGIIEDVMTSIKLLPGVGYSGMFNSLPSIRGGSPGDMTAALDGYYIEFPYYWGGGFSIFDPNMVASAQLSHGVFSARYGHTISGLLEVTSKKANPVSAALELGLSTSAVNLNVSLPLGSKGGLMIMGRVTFWGPYVWAAQQLSKVIDNEQLALVNAVSTAPYIRSGQINANYRFNADLEWTGTAFIGADGVGANYRNQIHVPYLDYESDMLFIWDSLQTFFITGLNYNPQASMLLKATVGAGLIAANANAKIDYDTLSVFEIDNLGNRLPNPPLYSIPEDYLDIKFISSEIGIYAQGRVDFDWDLGSGFIFAAGVHELFNQHITDWDGRAVFSRRVDLPKYYNNPLFPQYNSPYYYVQFPINAQNEVNNRRFHSSAYVVGEYSSQGKKFGAELGLRIDHLYFLGKGFDIQTMPVLNPRLNLDYNVLKNRGIVESLDLTFGTGLFSSMNSAIATITVDGINDFTLKPNRSWTSVVGIKIDLTGGWSFNLEGYFKYVFDRAYQYILSEPGNPNTNIVHRFNGDGLIWGFDLMLQKFESRYWDGWLSYTFTYAKYHEPERPAGLSEDSVMLLRDSGWYYPSFHRFHNLNLVLNFKPFRNFNIYTRIGLATGRPMAKVGIIESYPVELYNEGDNPLFDDPFQTVTRYRRDSYYDDNTRTTWSIPWDLKLSFYISSKSGKVLTEIYLAAENLMSLFYVAKANTSFNSYTGQEDTGSDSASYEMPIPMISFGFRWSF